MFPCLFTHHVGNIVVETTIASHEAEMFPKKFENILVTVALFPYFPNFSNVIKIRAMVNNSYVSWEQIFLTKIFRAFNVSYFAPGLSLI